MTAPAVECASKLSEPPDKGNAPSFELDGSVDVLVARGVGGVDEALIEISRRSRAELGAVVVVAVVVILGTEVAVAVRSCDGASVSGDAD